MTRTLRNAGDRGLLIDCTDLDEVLTLAAAIRDAALGGVMEVVPAAQTVLVTLDRFADLAAIRSAVSEIEPAAQVGGEVREHLIPVRYDGEDLEEVARILGISTSEVIARHTAAEYTVAFGGFAPGFGYLAAQETTLDVPRRSSPRTRVPAGAVALAGIFSSIYPRSSPGGWQLIGSSDVILWDETRDPAALFAPGDRVRFIDMNAESSTDPSSLAPTRRRGNDDNSDSDDAHDPNERDDNRCPALLVIRRPGLQALIQDGGRPASAGIGAPPSGALDRPAMYLANWLVGNPRSAAVIEFAFGGAELEALGEATVALTGAPAPIEVVRASGRGFQVTDQQAIALSPGDRLRLGAPTSGARTVLALRGGIAATPVAGSVATDTLSGIGPAPLKEGREIRSAGLAVTLTEYPQPWPDLAIDQLTVPVLLGPRDDWFTTEAVELLFAQAWTVTPSSDRVGMRLEGEQSLERDHDGELPSEGMVTGSLQVPPNGQPVLFLNDHPVTGGYPVIGVVHSSALPALAQARPGMTVRFTRLEA